MSGFIRRMQVEELISKLCSKSMLITCCIILALTTGCKESPQNSTSAASLAAYGGKAHTFMDLPGYFVEFVTSDEHGRTHSFCSGSHIGDGYILTAAHCLDSFLNCEADLNNASINVIVSSSSGRREQRWLGLVEVDGIAIHAGWTPSQVGEKNGTGDDIALIKTDLPIAEQADLPEHSFDTQHPRFSSGELWFYGIGGNVESLSSHHEQPESHTTYFGGMVSIDGASVPPDQQIEQWMRQAETHSLLTEKAREYLHHLRQRHTSAANKTGIASQSSSSSLLMDITSHVDSSSDIGISTVPKTAVLSDYLFDDTAITPPTDQEPEIVIYPTNYDHPHAIDRLCHGDSGGPLIFRSGGDNSTNQDILLGVASQLLGFTINIRNVKDLVLHYNHAGEKYMIGGDIITNQDLLRNDCYHMSTTEQQLISERALLSKAAAVNVWYYRPWIDAAKQSLTSGQHSPLSAVAACMAF